MKEKHNVVDSHTGNSTAPMMLVSVACFPHSAWYYLLGVHLPEPGRLEFVERELSNVQYHEKTLESYHSPKRPSSGIQGYERAFICEGQGMQADK